MSDKNYTVQTKINRPVSVVFEAIVREDKICQYFVDRTSGPLEEGKQITWHWSQWGDYPVVVTRIIANELIHLQMDPVKWKKTDEDTYTVDIFLELESLEDDATMLKISESGWPIDAAGLKGSHENCSGWTHMAMCLKAFVEYEINLRS